MVMPKSIIFHLDVEKTEDEKIKGNLKPVYVIWLSQRKPFKVTGLNPGVAKV